MASTWNQREGPGRGHSEGGRRGKDCPWCGQREAGGARTDPGVDRGQQAGHGPTLVWTEAGRRGTDRPWVDRGDRTGIRVGRTQKGRKRHQRYGSKGGGGGSLGGNGHKMESQMGGAEFGHKGVAVTMVGDSLQYPPSGEAEVGSRGCGARGRRRGRGRLAMVRARGIGYRLQTEVFSG